MSKAAFSVYAFAVYLFIMGIILMVAPNFLLTTFGLPETGEVWIRVVGMLTIVLSVYYSQASRKEWTDFFWLTVYIRSSIILFFAVFVWMELVDSILILFGVVDLLGAIWTWWALRAGKA